MMKTTRSFNLVKVLLLAVLAAGLSASLAHAQRFNGKFTLPFAATWGKAFLPPGDYSFDLHALSENPNHLVTIRQGTSAVGMVVADGGAERKLDGSSALIAVRSGGKYTIRALRLAEAELVLQYLPPKAQRRVLAQLPVLIQRVPVVAAGK